MLTIEEMRAAIFARSVNNDPDFDGDKDQAVYDFEFANCWATDENGNEDRAERRQIAEKAKNMYLAGNKILEGYTLKFRDSRPYGCPMTYKLAEDEQSLTIENGYIATSLQEVSVIFRPRR